MWLFLYPEEPNTKVILLYKQAAKVGVSIFAHEPNERRKKKQRGNSKYNGFEESERERKKFLFGCYKLFRCDCCLSIFICNSCWSMFHIIKIIANQFTCSFVTLTCHFTPWKYTPYARLYHFTENLYKWMNEWMNDNEHLCININKKTIIFCASHRNEK